MLHALKQNPTTIIYKYKKLPLISRQSTVWFFIMSKVKTSSSMGARSARNSSWKAATGKQTLEFVLCPEYSTERYYLLSEIEEHSSELICCDDEGLDLDLSSLAADETKLVAHYLTWNMSHGMSQLLRNAGQHMSACGGDTMISKHSLVIIDALFSSGDFSNVMVKNAASEGIAELRAGVFRRAGCILLGLSNNPTAAPALDNFHEHVKDREWKQLKWTIVSAKRVNFLGHEGELSFVPDAASNVIQQYTSQPELKSYLKDNFRSFKSENDDIFCSKIQEHASASVVRMQIIIIVALAALFFFIYAAEKA